MTITLTKKTGIVAGIVAAVLGGGFAIVRGIKAKKAKKADPAPDKNTKAE